MKECAVSAAEHRRKKERVAVWVEGEKERREKDQRVWRGGESAGEMNMRQARTEKDREKCQKKLLRSEGQVTSGTGDALRRSRGVGKQRPRWGRQSGRYKKKKKKGSHDTKKHSS